jgi:hypothetical protein
VATKLFVFWDIMPCSPVKVNRRFEHAYRLRLPGRRVSRARYVFIVWVTADVIYRKVVTL